MTTPARVLVHTGKGGVGKTTVAAATAVGLAHRGYRTLVMSTDVAHSLADVLDHPLGDSPITVAPRLDAEQLRTHDRLGSGWHEIADYLQSLLAWAGAGVLEAAELAVLPGLDELFALLDLHAHACSGRYDVVVVDCAPTAETLRLLNLPDVLGWYVERLLPVQRQLTRALRPTVGRLSAMPLPRDAVFGAVHTLHRRLRDARDLLIDPATTTVRLVITAERVVLAEARRTLAALAVFGHTVDAVVVNRLVPASISDPLLVAWRDAQARLAADTAAAFGAIPQLRAELTRCEPVGLARLAAFGDQLYGVQDAAAVLYDGPRAEVVSGDHGHTLRLPLPGGTAEDVDLLQRADELYVTVGDHRRTLVLPTALAPLAVTSATVADGWLAIGFGGTRGHDPADVVANA